jgi:hypothetical protein
MRRRSFMKGNENLIHEAGYLPTPMEPKLDDGCEIK